MRHKIILLVLTLVSLFTLVNTASSEPSVAIQWQPYSNDAFVQAKKSNQLILLCVKSKTCHWCKEMDDTTWANPAVISVVQNHFIPVTVDFDAQQNVAMRYRVSSFPTTIILDSTNHIIKIFSGFFPPDYMQTNLSKILTNWEHPAGNGQPIAEPIKTVAVPANVLISDNFRDQLIKKQIDIYEKFNKNATENKPTNLDLASIKYALIFSATREKLAYNWISNMLNSQHELLDPVWGGVYTITDDGKISFAKSTLTQATDLLIYLEVYAYWPDPIYLDRARHLVSYINTFLTSPEGVFYAGQAAASQANFYQLDDAKRRNIGVPPIDTHIYAKENGFVITALVNYYMITGDTKILDEALKATRWIINNLSAPGGGYRHEKTENNIIYLGDSIAMGTAFADLYKATTNPEYLNRALDTMRFVNTYFQNSDGKPGFVSRLDLTQNTADNFEQKQIDNEDVVRLASILYSYTGDDFLQKMRLSAFHYLVEPSVIKTEIPALVLLAEYKITNYALHITIVGPKDNADAKVLYAAALASLPLNARIDWWDPKEGPLLNSDVEYSTTDKPAAYVCHGFQCSFPIYNARDLRGIIHDIILPTKTIQIMSQVLPKAADGGSGYAAFFKNPLQAEKLLTDQSWFFILLGFIILGLLLSFTPCMLPLVPIMASIIVGQTIGFGRGKTFLLCLAYVIAMSFTYAVFGLLAGASGVYLETYLQSTWVLIAFSVIFFILGLIILEGYEIRLPNAWQQKISAWSNHQKGGDYIGVIGMGILAPLILSPCVTAPLVGVLSFVTKTGDYVLGAVGLFFMGIGMGLPLLIICLFSKNILPRAARWNSKIKVLLGMVLLGLSVWIISRVVDSIVSLSLWSAFIIFLTLYMGLLRRKAKNLSQKLWKTFTLMLFAFGVALFWYAIFINSNVYTKLVTNRNAFVAENDSLFKNVQSKDELTQAFAQAKQNHLPILLDFTAKWCASCVKMEREVLSDKDIVPLLKRFYLIRIDLTNINSESMAIAKQYNIAGPPMILFFDDVGQAINVQATGDLDVEQFKKILRQALDVNDKLSMSNTVVPRLLRGIQKSARAGVA